MTDKELIEALSTPLPWSSNITPKQRNAAVRTMKAGADAISRLSARVEELEGGLELSRSYMEHTPGCDALDAPNLRCSCGFEFANQKSRSLLPADGRASLPPGAEREGGKL
jgi:hypothetical protein